MLLIQRWSWKEGEHWKWSVFFFRQIQNCYSIFAYLYKYMRFYDQFWFLFSGKFLIFSCVYVFAVILEVQWVCLYWGLGEFDWFVMLWDWFGWIKDLFFYWFFYGHALFGCWESPGKSSELWNWCLFFFLKFDLLLGCVSSKMFSLLSWKSLLLQWEFWLHGVQLFLTLYFMRSPLELWCL